MLGLVVNVREESCEQPRFKKLVVELFDGKQVSSRCYFEEEVKQSVKIIKVYVEIARKHNAIGKLQVIEPTSTERNI